MLLLYGVGFVFGLRGEVPMNYRLMAWSAVLSFSFFMGLACVFRDYSEPPNIVINDSGSRTARGCK